MDTLRGEVLLGLLLFCLLLCERVGGDDGIQADGDMVRKQRNLGGKGISVDEIADYGRIVVLRSDWPGGNFDRVTGRRILRLQDKRRWVFS